MSKNNELQLYLASGSPRRRELLTQLGYRFEVLKLDVPEQREEGEKAQDYVCRLAATRRWPVGPSRLTHCRCWAPTP